MQTLAKRPPKGRGAISNPAGRFERLRGEAFDDGWPGDEDAPPRLSTTVTEEACRSVISSNASPDVPFELSINPYRGCEHGCVYCYARPSHAHMGLSPGLDFETRLFAKTGAPQVLEEELRRPGYRCRTIVLGANTDPYQPIERRYRITRRLLAVLAAHRHPVAITTKSALVLRDVDIIAPMAEQGLAAVNVSVTTLDAGLARRMEPRAAAPAKRLETIARLAGAGIPCAVLAAPMIPALNDCELEAILAAAAGAGARAAGYILLRLPHELKDLFAEWLDAHAPLKARRVLRRIAECRGGRLNDPRFGARMRGSGPHADLLERRFDAACRRLGLKATNELRLETGRFRLPPRPGDQLNLW